jgi:hypothetical protein
MILLRVMLPSRGMGTPVAVKWAAGFGAPAGLPPGAGPVLGLLVENSARKRPDAPATSLDQSSN